jgi:VWFA-related protein
VIDAFEGRRGDYQPRTDFERRYIVTDRGRADEQRAQSTWSTLNALTLHLANLGAGRSSVLLVSEQADPLVVRRRGFEGLPTSTSVTRTANRSNVSIYVFDPRDAAQRAASPDEGPNLLRVLADDTDGAIVSGPDSAGAGLRRMLADASSYYLLSYRSARYRDGLYHGITVIVRRPGVHVSARNGYWAPTPDEIQRANMIAHANDPPPPLKTQPARQ